MLAAYSQEGPSGSLGTGRPTSGERATESNGRVVSYYLAPGEKKQQTRRRPSTASVLMMSLKRHVHWWGLKN